MVCDRMLEIQAREADAMDHIRLVCDRGKKGRWIELFHLAQSEQAAHCDKCEVCGELRKAA